MIQRVQNIKTIEQKLESRDLRLGFWLAVAIWLAGIIIRIMVFRTSQHDVSGDEAMVGLMARDILHGKNFPVLYYGHAFEGGSALVAYLAVPIFWIFGVSSASLRYCSFITFSLTYWIGYLWIRRYFQEKAANYFSALLAISPPIYTIWSLYAYGTHDLIFLLLFGLFWLHWEILYRGMNTVKGYFLFGIYCGFAAWMHLGVVPAILVCLLFSYLQEKRFLSSTRLDAFGIGSILGAFPFLLVNLQNKWLGIKWIFEFSYHHSFLQSFKDLAFHAFPRTFGWSDFSQWSVLRHTINLGRYYGVFCYLLTLLLLLYFILEYRNELRVFVRRLFSTQWRESWTPSPSLIWVFYAILWMLTSGQTSWATYGKTVGFYWYFLPFFLPLFAGLPMVITGKVISKNSALFFIKIFFQTCFWILLVSSLFFNLNHIKQGMKLQKSRDTLSDVQAFLYKNNLRNLYANDWAKQPLELVSDGYLQISDQGITDSEVSIYSLDTFYNSSTVAYVLSGNKFWNPQLEKYLAEYKIPHKEKSFETLGHPNNWTVYYSFDTPLRPPVAFSYGDIAKFDTLPGLTIVRTYDDCPNGNEHIPYRLKKDWPVTGGAFPPYWCARTPAWTEMDFPSLQWIDYIQIRFADWVRPEGPPSPLVWDHDIKSFQPGDYPKSSWIWMQYQDESTKEYVDTVPAALIKSNAKGCYAFRFAPVQTRSVRIVFVNPDKSNPYVYVSDIICSKATKE